jgi:ketosteroid isomerase-like protein
MIGSTTDEIRRLADVYAEAWERRDIDAIMSLHTTDSVFEMHTGQPPAVGLEAVRGAFLAGLAVIPDARFERRRLQCGEDFWVTELTLTGHIGSGVAIRVESVDVVTVRTGLVARKETYLDPASIVRAVLLRPWLWFRARQPRLGPGVASPARTP